MVQSLVTGQPGTVRGRVRVPGDKSISHRAVMLGALADGQTRISGFLEGADALATRNAFRAMGVRIEGPAAGSMVIHGVGVDGLRGPTGPLDCGNSGTSMRLLAGILAGQRFESVLVGDESLSRRPMRRVIDPLTMMGAAIDSCDGKPPLTVRACSTPLDGIDFEMTVASAQVKSAVLLSGLLARGVTRVAEPAPTRDHTERMLKGFGVVVGRDGAAAMIEGGQRLKGCDIEVPADISSAAFFLVAASICPGSDLVLPGVGVNPTRIGVLHVLRAMGARIHESNHRVVGGEPVADLHVVHSPLSGIDVPPEWVPLGIDEFPALFVAAACAEGVTTVCGAEELRVKESDRIAAMATGFAALGVDVEPRPDGMRILGAGNDSTPFASGTIDSVGDHRIAMAFAVASLRARGALQILNSANVNTSFPDFVDTARSVGIDIRAVDSGHVSGLHRAGVGASGIPHEAGR